VFGLIEMVYVLVFLKGGIGNPPKWSPLVGKNNRSENNKYLKNISFEEGCEIMKKIGTVFLFVAFLSVLFTGPAFCESSVMDDSDPVISQDDLKDGESILDLLTPDEAEAAPLERDARDPYEENFNKGDDLPFYESDTEDDKIQEEEDEKEKNNM
jgi:hypothetical protein